MFNYFHRILMTGMDNNGEEVALFESVYGPVDFRLSPYIIFWDPPLQCGYCIKNYIMGKLNEISLKNTAIWMVSVLFFESQKEAFFV